MLLFILLKGLPGRKGDSGDLIYPEVGPSEKGMIGDYGGKGDRGTSGKQGIGET